MPDSTRATATGTVREPAPIKPACGPLAPLAVADPLNDPFYDYFAARLKAAVPRVIDRLSPHLDDQARDHVRRCGELFTSMSSAVQREIVTHPFFHYYWLKIMEACRDGDLEYVRRELPDLARFLVVPLLRSGTWDGEPLPIIIRAGQLRFAGHLRHIAHGPTDGTALGTVSLNGDQLIVSGSGHQTIVPLRQLLGDESPDDRSPVRIRAHIPGTEIEIDGGDPYVARLFTSMKAKPLEEGEPLRELTTMDTVAPEIVSAFGEAHRLLAMAWPAIIPELRTYTRLVIPFESATYSTFTENALMGAVFMAEGRQPFSSALYTAEHLLHEHSHLRLALVMEMDPLYEAEENTRFHSPWRGTARPVLGVVQGAFVFARICHFLNRAYVATGDGRFLERRHEVRADLRTALSALVESDGLSYTEIGTALLADISAETETPDASGTGQVDDGEPR